MKVFFVKYNDPIYVKMEKLDIMIRLASQANVAQVLSELKEYASLFKKLAKILMNYAQVRHRGRCRLRAQVSARNWSLRN